MRYAPLVFMIAACGGGDDSPSNPRDDGGIIEPSPDAMPDARVPITTHRGLVQAVAIGSTSGQLAAGFYETPTTAAGCTWTYSGPCSLTTCVGAGITAADAGVITGMIGTNAVTLTPANATYNQTSAGALTPGTAIQVSAAGNTVPAFTAGPVTMPTAVAVTAPTTGSMLSKASALTTTWTAGTGDVYVNLSQMTNGGPYPASHARTIRCTFPSQDGTATVPADMIGGLESGMSVQLVVGGVDLTTVVSGAYEIELRALAVDSVRQLNVVP